MLDPLHSVCVRAAYAVAHHLLCTRTQACKKLLHWLQDNAVWEEGEEGQRYMDNLIPQEFRSEQYEATWCHDAALLSRMCSDP